MLLRTLILIVNYCDPLDASRKSFKLQTSFAFTQEALNLYRQ